MVALDREDIVSMTDLQGMLFLGISSFLPNLPSTLMGIFEITYNGFSSQLSTNTSEYKKPLGGNFINYINNEPINFTLSGVQFKNAFTNKFNLGLSKDNFGYVLIQALRISQRKLPILISTSHYVGSVILENATMDINNLESDYTLSFKQAELFREFESASFTGEVSNKQPTSQVSYLQKQS